MALRAARDSLPDQAKAKSPKKFTQPQLMVCLVIKEFLQLDYRGTHILLNWGMYGVTPYEIIFRLRQGIPRILLEELSIRSQCLISILLSGNHCHRVSFRE